MAKLLNPSPKKTKLEIDLTPKQDEAFSIFDNWDYTEVLNDGGVRSGKTFVTLLWLIKFCVEVPAVKVIIGRRKFKHLKRSLYSQTLEPLLAQLPDMYYTINKTDWKITFYNGSQMWLAGLDDTEKMSEIMGTEFLIAYLNEATEIDKDMITKIRTRLAQKVLHPKSKKPFPPRLLYDCNPTTDPEADLNIQFNRDVPYRKRLHWETEDNKANLTDAYINQLKHNLTHDEQLRLMGGIWLGVGEQVYRNINKERIITEYNIKDFSHLAGGIDWGYISAFSLWGIDASNNKKKAVCLIEIETQGKTTSEFMYEIEEELQNIQAMRLRKSAFTIYADHEPDRIKEANQLGFKLKPAHKAVSPGDSSVNWFDKWFMDSCTNTFRSMKNLKNKLDDRGNPIDGNHLGSDDHSADAARYALHSIRMEVGFELQAQDIQTTGSRRVSIEATSSYIDN